MLDFFKWSVEFLGKSPDLNWLNNRKDDWTPLLASKLRLLLEEKAFVVLCDDERSWFCEYIVKKINRQGNMRPILPFFSLKSIYRNRLSTREDFLLLNDMLNLSFANGYVFFYIGEGNHPYAQIAKSHENSYMWLINEHIENSFYLDGKDELLDIKLIQLFKFLDKSIDAVIFDEVVF